MRRHLMEHPRQVRIVRLDGGSDPDWDLGDGPFSALLRTPDETTVVCEARVVPKGVRSEGPYAVIEVAGPLEFGAVGVLLGILEPLVASGIGILGYSSFDTDWILVPSAQREEAIRAWRRAGLIVTPTTLPSGGAS